MQLIYTVEMWQHGTVEYEHIGKLQAVALNLAVKYTGAEYVQLGSLITEFNIELSFS